MGLLVGRGGALMLQAASFGYAAKQAGPEKFGPVAAAMGLISFLVVFADAGLNSAAIRELAADPSSRLWSQMLKSRFVLTASVALLWSALTCGLAFWNSDSATYGLLIPLGLYFLADVMSDALMSRDVAHGHPRRPSINLLVRRTIATVCTVALFSRIGLMALTVGLALGACVGAAAALKSQWPYWAISDHGLKLREQFRQARPYWLTSMASQAQNLDSILVLLVAGSVQAGLFGAPARILGPLGIGASTFAAAVLPHSARGASRKEIAQGTTYLVVFSGLAFAVLAVIATPVVQTLFGPQYHDSVLPFQLLLIGLWVSTVNQPLAGYLQGIGYAHDVAQVLLKAMPLGLVVAAIGADVQGAAGAAMGVVFVQVVICIGLMRAFRQRRIAASPMPSKSILESP